jgi:DNA-binding HxlR family transcriptional regulator
MAEQTAALQSRGGPVPKGLAVEGLKQCDLWNAMRKFANPDIAQIAEVLYRNGPLNLGTLRDKTGLTTNVLNHDLIEMRNAEIVAKIDREYCLTKYGALLIEAIERIKNDIFKAAKEDIFQPAQECRSENMGLVEA